MKIRNYFKSYQRRHNNICIWYHSAMRSYLKEEPHHLIFSVEQEKIMDIVQLDQYIMNLCTFRSETWYSSFISILSLKTFSLKQLQFTLPVRAYLHWEMETKVRVILQSSQETLHMFSPECKPVAFYPESHLENGYSH